MSDIDYAFLLARLYQANTFTRPDLHMSLHEESIAAIKTLLNLTRALAATHGEYKAAVGSLVQRLVQEDLVPRECAEVMEASE